MRILLLLLLLMLVPRAYGATIVAASSSRDDVQAAHDSASDGDTVEVPAGTSAFTTVLTITKAITLRGAGTNQTIWTDNIVAADGRMVAVSQVPNLVTTLEGITFTNGNRSTTLFEGALRVIGTNTLGGAVRLTKLNFDNIRGPSVRIAGAIGVMDNCGFLQDGARVAVYIFHASYGNKTYGDGSWEAAVDHSSTNAWFVEACTYTNSATRYAFVDAWNGARYVARNNLVYNGWFDAHGTESSLRLRGTRYVQIYSNIIDVVSGSMTDMVDIRSSGSSLIWGNTGTGTISYTVRLNNYRAQQGFAPWGSTDGLTSLFDTPDLTDGAGTPGGAGDGVFDSGTLTSGGVDTATDTSKAWGVNAWDGYQFREVHSFTATSGASGSATVSGAGWTVNQWVNYMFDRGSSTEMSRVTSNTSDTITLDTSNHASFSMSGGGAFTLVRSAEIASNTSDTITTFAQITSNYTFPTGAPYEIRKIDYAFDQPGRGITSDLTGSADQPPNQTVTQTLEPIYAWNNTINGTPQNIQNGYSSIRLSRDYYNSEFSYTPPTYPHPLRGETTFTPAAISGRVTIGGRATIR
jgi:hypothetical protein